MSLIGIFGGSFNPITTSHVWVAQSLLDLHIVNEVWFLPSYTNYHQKDLVDLSHRMAMCRLATANDPRLKVWDWEEKHQRTLDLSILDPTIHRWILGMDKANEIMSWPDGKKLISSIPCIIVSRGKIIPLTDWFHVPPHRYLQLDGDLTDGSSTEARTSLSSSYLNPSERRPEILNPTVKDYIQKYNLYQLGRSSTT